MDGFEDKLNKILSDPKSLERVMSLAKSIGGGGPSGSAEPAAPAAAPSHSDGLGGLGALSGGGGGLDGLGALLGGAGGLGGLGALLGGGDGLDPRLMSGLLELLGEFNRKDDRRGLLLGALKPYVREERRQKMDRAALIVRLARTAHKALGMLGGGDGNV